METNQQAKHLNPKMRVDVEIRRQVRSMVRVAAENVLLVGRCWDTQKNGNQLGQDQNAECYSQHKRGNIPLYWSNNPVKAKVASADTCVQTGPNLTSSTILVLPWTSWNFVSEGLEEICLSWCSLSREGSIAPFLVIKMNIHEPGNNASTL